MRNPLLFFIFVLTVTAFVMLFGQVAGVVAIGAATDNATMPSMPSGDQSQDIIEPPVKYVLMEPSSQPEVSPPKLISTFIGASEEHPFEVNPGENWYLDLDINTPGWLYIYNYFPIGESVQGQWIAYKWQLQESGHWRLGPFIASDNLPYGQHMYGIWFYSEEQSASEEPGISQSNLIYWTYSKGQPAEQSAMQKTPQPPVAPVKEAGGLERVYQVITQPLSLVVGIILLIAIVVFGLYFLNVFPTWRIGKDAVLLDPDMQAEMRSTVSSSVVASAKIVLPNGIEIRLDSGRWVMGREDLARVLSLDELHLISRQHFEVKMEDDTFCIEDLGSANGTWLNGKEIAGIGTVPLSDDDIIEPAGVIQLRFFIL
jgi:hypothetical protein